VGIDMADRDTTATPYKLSPDGLVYFHFPAGNAPVVQVADYAELRTKGQADAGGSYRIVVTDAGIAGAFAWRPDDPKGNGDDGGMVIAATDGWWYRVYAYGRDRPVELSWYEFSSGDDSTAVFEQLFAAYPAGVAVRMPDFAGHIVVNTISVQIPEFTLLGGVTELWQHASPTDDFYVFILDNVSYLNVDSSLVCRGRYGDFGVSPGNAYAPGAFFTINDVGGALSFGRFYPSVNDTTGFGLRLGNSLGNDLKIGSRMVNSGIRVSANSGAIHFDNASSEDPYGNGLKDYTQGLYEKWHGIWVVGAVKVTGKILLRYGGEQWFMSGQTLIGSSEADPFTIEQNDIGYDPQGQPNGDAFGTQWNGGKIDALSTSVTELGSRFMRFVTDGHNRNRHSWMQFEASTEAGELYATNYINVDYVINSPTPENVVTRIGEFNAGNNECRGNRLTGNIYNMSVSGSENLWDNCEITFIRFWEQHGHVPMDNVISGGTIADYIWHRSGTLTLDNVVFIGGARRIVDIENAGDNVVLNINNLSAPSGSTIELTTADPDPQFYLDDVLTPLPYTVP